MNASRPVAERISTRSSGMRFFDRLVHCVHSAFVLLAVCTVSYACPFCTTPEPTLAERREAAEIVLLAEAGESRQGEQSFKVHRAITGTELWQKERSTNNALELKSTLPVGSLSLLFAGASDESTKQRDWQPLAVDETSLGYFLRAPSLRVTAVERLPYFVKFLEHPDSTIAADAYAEFGRAPYDAVVAVADKFPQGTFRAYLVDPAVPGERKGFYGLALGMATEQNDRAANRELLGKLVDERTTDFRSGFDGVLGGYLLLTGVDGLKHLEQQLLIPRDAPRGDVLHAITALRFYHEFGRGIPPSDLQRAMSHLLDRPDSAASAIVDLARWQAWDIWPRVVKLWDRSEYQDRPTRRAIVGYLQNMPGADGERELAALRKRDPAGVAEVERSTIPPGLGR